MRTLQPTRCPKALIGILCVVLGSSALSAGPAFSQTESKFPAGSNGQTWDTFGSRVSISGEYAIVSSPAHSPAGYNFEATKAHIYKKTTAGWVEQAKLSWSFDESDIILFASSVSISGPYAIVGARHYGGLGASKAFIYHRDGTNWTQAQILEPSNNFGWQLDNDFGISVSISGDHAVVGANNRAYVFKRSGQVWTEQAILTPPTGDPPRSFGRSVSISGNYAIVGIEDFPWQPVPADPASAYVFVTDGTSWSLQAKLIPGSGIQDRVKQSVSIGGDYAIVGEVTYTPSLTYQGKAYIFRRDGTQWEKQVDLTPAPNTAFGSSVAMGAHYAVVGSPSESHGGTAYVFNHKGAQLTKIHASDGVSGNKETDAFGASVSVDGTTIVVGAPFKNVGEVVNQGSVYGYYYLGMPRYFDVIQVLPYDICFFFPLVCLENLQASVQPEGWAVLPPAQREFLIGLQLVRMAPLVADDRIKHEIQRAGFLMMRNATRAIEGDRGGGTGR